MKASIQGEKKKIPLIATRDGHIYRRRTSKKSKEGNTYHICYYYFLTKKDLKQRPDLERCPTTASLIEDTLHIQTAHNHEPDHKWLQNLEASADCDYKLGMAVDMRRQMKKAMNMNGPLCYSSYLATGFSSILKYFSMLSLCMRASRRSVGTITFPCNN